MEHQKNTKTDYKRTKKINKKRNKVIRVGKVSKKYQNKRGGGGSFKSKTRKGPSSRWGTRKSNSLRKPLMPKAPMKRNHRLIRRISGFLTKRSKAKKRAEALRASRTESKPKNLELARRKLPPTPPQIEQMKLMQKRIRNAKKSRRKNAKETKARQKRLLKVYNIQQKIAIQQAQNELLRRIDEGVPSPPRRPSLGPERQNMNQTVEEKVALRDGEFTI